VELFELAAAGRMREARKLYDWFLPLLRLDTVPEFVQLIKLVQQELGCGSAVVRLPRMEVTGREAERVRALLAQKMAEHEGAKSGRFE
jgi:4-hydroxy-tetrahydrodipicolinate synthase